MTKFDIISHDGYTTIKKVIGKNIIEVDTRRPFTVYMQYGYYNGVGPWHSTSAIHYGGYKFGYDTPTVWNKRTIKILPALFDIVEKITALEKDARDKIYSDYVNANSAKY